MLKSLLPESTRRTLLSIFGIIVGIWSQITPHETLRRVLHVLIALVILILLWGLRAGIRSFLESRRWIYSVLGYLLIGLSLMLFGGMIASQITQLPPEIALEATRNSEIVSTLISTIEVDQIEVTPEAQSSPAPTESPTLAPTETPTLPPTITLTPTINPYVPVGKCDETGTNRPCILSTALSWSWLGEKFFSEIEACRWPEIATLNRFPDGNYFIPLENAPLLIPPPAPRDTYIPGRWDAENDIYIPFPECSPTSTKPCFKRLEKTMYNEKSEGYCTLFKEIYGLEHCFLSQAEDLMIQNRDSFCGIGVELEEGVIIVFTSTYD